MLDTIAEAQHQTEAPVVPEMYTAADIAPRLGLSTRRVLALIRAGKLPGIKTGRRTVRIPRAAFEVWMAEQNQSALASVPPAVAALRAILAKSEDSGALSAVWADMERQVDEAFKGFQTYLKNSAPHS